MTNTSISRIPIFPTTVYQIEIPTEHYANLIQLCTTLKWRRTEDNSRSMCGIFNNTDFHPFFEWVNGVIAELFDEIYCEPFADGLEICAAWVNRSERSECTNQHKHPWSMISGIVYLTGEDGFTTFVQNNPYDPTPVTCISRRYQYTQSVPILKGSMLLFPSQVDHYVTDNESDVPRHTLSFNTMPRNVNRDDTVQFNS